MKAVAVLIGAGLGLAALPAQATLMISINVGGTVVSCVDNAACDTNPAIGTLSLADQTINGVTLTGSSQTSVGTPANPNPLDILNTSSLQVSNTTGASVNIQAAVGDTSFKAPVSQFNTATSGVWQNAVGSTITTNFFDDPANAQGATSPSTTPGNQIDTFTSTAALIADSYSHNASGAVSDMVPFSMTEHFTATLVAGGELVNRGQTEIKVPTAVVPEPSSLALLGGSLLMLGFVARRQRR